MNFKGEFCLEDCDITDQIDKEKLADLPSSSLVNKNIFPFQITNHVSGGEFLLCYSVTREIRDLFQLIISARNAHILSIKKLLMIPDKKTGWLTKRGHIVNNWKKRFFVLNYGVLSYFENDGLTKKGAGK